MWNTLKKLSLMSVGVLALRLANAQCDPTPSGLVAWWPGEGNANDIVGNNNGILVGGTTFTAGEVGQAFHFDGVSGTVSVPSSSELNFGTNDFTVEFWVRFQDLVDQSNGLVSKDSYAGGSAYAGWVINIADGLGGFGIETRHLVAGNGPDTNARWVKSNLSTLTWYHVAAIRQSSILSLFVNGVLRASAQELLLTDVNCATEQTIGSLNAGHLQQFQGDLDEVSIFNRALSSTEVAAIYAAGSAGKCRTPFITIQPKSEVGYWGQSVTFSVAALPISPPLNYQWQSNSVAISGATNQTLTLTNLQNSFAAGYSVVIANSYGSVTSAPPANLTINPAGVGIALYPGVQINGVVGYIYGIQSTTNLSDPNSWVGRTNLTFTQLAEIWPDYQPSPVQTFYRVLQGPIPIP